MVLCQQEGMVDWDRGGFEGKKIRHIKILNGNGEQQVNIAKY